MALSFTAETERDKRDWMEALQDTIAETLSDYEVAEKIWSNRSNRTCADCRALNPDWASINLCVVICKNCAGTLRPSVPGRPAWGRGWWTQLWCRPGQHRGLGTMVSKVQSLKLDTSVWSNEIVQVSPELLRQADRTVSRLVSTCVPQLFIMLGNDRANEFWAAGLGPSQQLDPDASPEQRKDFITQKYREGRYRLRSSAFSSQEELLKVPPSLSGQVQGQGPAPDALSLSSTGPVCRRLRTDSPENRHSGVRGGGV